jgi:hypothetical protein
MILNDIERSNFQEVYHLQELRKTYRAELMQLEWKLQKLRSSVTLEELAFLDPSLPPKTASSARKSHKNNGKYRMSRSQSPTKASNRQTKDDNGEQGAVKGDREATEATSDKKPK